MPRRQLPPELAAIARKGTTEKSGRNQTSGSVLITPLQQAEQATLHSGSSKGTVGYETYGNYPIYTQGITNMSFYSSLSPHTPISVHIGTTNPDNKHFGQHHVIVSYTGDGRSLGPGSPTLDIPEPGGEYPTGISQTRGRPIPGSFPSFIGRRCLGLRGLGHQQK